MELTTCFWFDGNAREAAEFYTSIFPDSALERNWVAQSETPSNEIGEEVTVSFQIFGRPFLGINGGPQFPHSEAISFQIPCKDQDEIDHYWELLTKDGGEESQCGWLKDKFGVSWQVISPRLLELIGGPDPEAAARATEAMLQMRKIDLGVLEAAYRGEE